VGGLAQRFERPAEFKNVAIPIFPIVEKGKIAANGFRVGQRGVLRLPSPPLYRQAPTRRQCVEEMILPLKVEFYDSGRSELLTKIG
jgi:hypothetical protein